MKYRIFIWLLTINSLALAQGGGIGVPDSLREKVNNNKAIDSLRQLKQKANLQALQQKVSVQRLQDSLNIQSWGDSVRTKLNVRTKMDSLGLTKKIDSLQNLRLPTDKYKNKLDSVLAKREQLKSEIDGKQAELQEKTTGRLEKWEQDARAKLKLDSLGIGGNINTPGMESLSSQLPNGQLPGMPDLNLPTANLDLNSLGLPEMPSLNVEDFSGLNLSPDLSKLTSEVNLPNLAGLKEFTGKLGAVGGKVNEVSGMLKSPDKAAEAALGKVEEIGSAKKELGEMESAMKENEALEMAEKMKDPEALKEEAQKKAMEQAVDHFAGQEEMLKKSMSSLSKYKKKIPSLESLSKLPKHWRLPKNGLKGQPFRERFRPGINLGVLHLNDTLILKWYPQVSYRITGRLSAGVGGYYRLKETTKGWHMVRNEPQWGFTGFAVFKMVKSMHFRVEADAIHTTYRSYNPELITIQKWDWLALAGIQNIFKINKSFSANVQMLYDFKYKFINALPERLTLRFGVEYTLPKKKKKEEKNSNEAQRERDGSQRS